MHRCKNDPKQTSRQGWLLRALWIRTVWMRTLWTRTLCTRTLWIRTIWTLTICARTLWIAWLIRTSRQNIRKSDPKRPKVTQSDPSDPKETQSDSKRHKITKSYQKRLKHLKRSTPTRCPPPSSRAVWPRSRRYCQRCRVHRTNKTQMHELTFQIDLLHPILYLLPNERLESLAYQNVETQHQKEQPKGTQSDPKRPKRPKYHKKSTPNCVRCIEF